MALRDVTLLTSLNVMSKRQASDPKAARKKKKSNKSYKIFGLDPSDDEKAVAEDVRVWDISTSKNTGRMTARRRTLKHYSEVLPPGEPSTSQKQVEIREVAYVEDAGILADSETPPKTTDKQQQKRRRVRVVKENDSVSESFVSLPPLTYLGFQTRMEQWLQHRLVFLGELLRLDGLGDALNGPVLCPDCSIHQAQFMCINCSGEVMRCSTCTVSFHQSLPLHRLKVYQVSYTVLT